MGILPAILLGVVEGVTEFLPVSSTGHLTIVEKLLGYSINSPDITAFTAIIQIGAILATIVFFWRDIWRILAAWLAGVFDASKRATPDYRLGWAVIIGSVPIAVVGLLLKHQIEHGLRSLWIVAAALIGWSFVMLFADRIAKEDRKETATTWKDALIIGIAQCLALVPGVSRSGATISVGLLRGFDRVAATRLSFFLAIPALLAAGAVESVSKAGDISSGVGWTATITATITSFVVAYAAIAWLLKFVSKHNYTFFVVYRLAVGALLIVLLATGTISAT